MAIRNRITCYRHEDVILNFTMQPAVNITGWSIVFYLAGVAIGAAVTSSYTFSVSLSDDQTGRPPGTYQHEARRVDAGAFTVLSAGPFVILPSSVYR